MRPRPTQPALGSWRERLRALRNLPPLLRMVWETSPGLCVSTLSFRLVGALFPLATLWVSKLIIDLVVRALRHLPVDRPLIFKLLILELLLAVASDALGRVTTLVDSLLGDKFTNTSASG
jgi:ATP-binding cassette, subfamily B, bacterial